MRSWATWAAVGCVALAACGGGEERTAVGAGTPWEPESLDGRLGADRGAVLVSDGSRVVSLVTDDDGVLHPAATGPDGAFVAGPALDAALSSPGLGGAVATDDGWVALGSGRLVADGIDFEVRAFESPDGLEWREVDTTGLEEPGDVGQLAWGGGQVVAAGTLRTAGDPSYGGFVPVVWTSPDGRGWQQRELPLTGGPEGWAKGALVVDDRILVTGGSAGGAAMWSSTDGGVTWDQVESGALRGSGSFGPLVRNGDVILTTVHRDTPELGEHGEHGRSSVARSTDGGRTWTALDAPGASKGYAEPLYGGGGWFFTADPSSGRTVSYGPEVCYADLDVCRNPPALPDAVYASRDGTEWTRVDTRGVDGASHLSAIAGTDDGGIVFLTPSEDGMTAWRWAAGQPLAMREADPVAPPPTAEIDLIEEGDQADLGHRYAVPMSIHCENEWLYFDDRIWQLADPVADSVDHETWPVVGEMLYGYATLVGEGTVEYSGHQGERLATYHPATEPPPGCA